jgi:glycerate kinase
VLALDDGLRRFSQLVDVDPGTPGAGAAGGTAFGLLVWGASLVSGAEAVSELVGLPRLVAGADVVITGEGRLDEQTADGKAVSWVTRVARDAGAVVFVVAGSVETSDGDHDVVVPLSDLAGGAGESLRHPEYWAERAGALLAEHDLTTAIASRRRE